MRLIKAASRLALFALTGVVLFNITGCDDGGSDNRRKVTVVAIDANAVEGTPSQQGVFEIRLSGTIGSDRIINYTITGTASGADHNLSS